MIWCAPKEYHEGEEKVPKRPGRKKPRNPWCPSRQRGWRRKSPSRDHACKACLRKGPDFQVGDRVAVVRNNNAAGRKYPGRVIAVNKGLRNAGSTMGVEQQNECVRRYCNPFVSLITCDQCHCPTYYVYDVQYDTEGLVDGTVEKSVEFERLFPGAERAAPVVPEAEATLAVTPTAVEVEPSTAV